MRDGIHVASVARIGAAALVVLAIVVGAALALTRNWDGRGGKPMAEPRAWIAGPMLEAAPQTGLADYLAQKQRLIDGYAWIDKSAGVARIPIDVAMRALAARAAADAQPGRTP